MQNLPVCYQDVLAALPVVRAALSPTPLYAWPGLNDLLGFQFYLKHENHQPVGAFKVRGGIYLVSSLNEDERRAGILACSTGNHGQSLAFACRQFDVPCTIVVPRGNNADKNRAIRNLGAKLIEHGADFDEARDYLEQQLAPQGGRYVHSANEPKLIAGVGTMACEIFESLHEPDAILVPIGLGSGVCGTAVVTKAVHPDTEVIGVQAERSSAVVQAWRTGIHPANAKSETWAEGMATRVPASMTMEIMRELMDDALLVEENILRRATYALLKHTHNLAEGAGAATLAAAWKYRERFAGKTVVGILSGGNLDIAELPSILAAGDLSMSS